MRIGVGLAGILAMSNKEHRLIHENKTHRQRCTKYTVDSQEVKAMTNRFWERAAQKGTASYYCTCDNNHCDEHWFQMADLEKRADYARSESFTHKTLSRGINHIKRQKNNPLMRV
ncbi:hypothetical protein, partial [Vibrio anguillarum]